MITSLHSKYRKNGGKELIPYADLGYHGKKRLKYVIRVLNCRSFYYYTLVSRNNFPVSLYRIEVDPSITIHRFLAIISQFRYTE